MYYNSLGSRPCANQNIACFFCYVQSCICIPGTIYCSMYVYAHTAADVVDKTYAYFAAMYIYIQAVQSAQSTNESTATTAAAACCIVVTAKVGINHMNHFGPKRQQINQVQKCGSYQPSTNITTTDCGRARGSSSSKIMLRRPCRRFLATLQFGHQNRRSPNQPAWKMSHTWYHHSGRRLSHQTKFHKGSPFLGPRYTAVGVATKKHVGQIR